MRQEAYFFNCEIYVKLATLDERISELVSLKLPRLSSDLFSKLYLANFTYLSSHIFVRRLKNPKNADMHVSFVPQEVRHTCRE